jgi:predicted MPP superfamily phosphohydrolase
MKVLQILFFLTFSVGFIGVASFYLYRRFVMPLAFSPRWQRPLVGLFFAVVFFAVLAPGSVALSRLHFFSPLDARLVFSTGYVLMGFLSILLAFVVVGDLLLLARWFVWKKIAASRPILDRWAPRPHRMIILLIAVVLTALGYLNGLHPVVREVSIPMHRLPLELSGYRIALISDLHVGLTIDREYVAEVVEKTNAQNPDLVVLVGDVADGIPASVEPMLEPLAGLRARHGLFYVTGNHEYYWNDVNGFVRIMRRLGFTVLENEHALVRQGMATLVLAGIPDIQAERYYPDHKPDLVKTFRDAPADANSLRVLLAHQPKVAKYAAEWGVQLQVSGHTHGGQFFPWTLVVPLVQAFAAGLYDYEGMKVFVGVGAAGWGPPLRLGSTAEIPILTLEQSP